MTAADALSYTRVPEEERREVLRVVAVEQERTATDPDFRQFVYGSDDHQLSTARCLQHTARLSVVLAAIFLDSKPVIMAVLLNNKCTL